MGVLFNIKAIPSEDIDRLISGNHEVFGDTVTSAYLEKAWGGIHYLISGSSTSVIDENNPAHFLMSGVLFEDAAEHVAFHTAAQVRSFANLLNSHSDAELLQRFNPDEMNRLDIYGGPWDPHSKQYIAQFFPDLRSFINEAVSQNCGTITIIG